MRRCSVDEESKYRETALHIACFRGHFEVAQYLIQEKEASLLAVDSDENTVLHYATSSNNGKLLMWLLSRDDIKTKIDAKNKVNIIICSGRVWCVCVCVCVCERVVCVL
jgi:ankyrin repeat protein